MSVISLEEAKNYLRVDGNDDDALIIALIETAEQAAENYTERIFLTRTFEFVFDSAGDSIEIPKSPLQEVVKIETIDAGGMKSEVNSSIYDVDTTGLRGRVQLKSGCAWPIHRGFASFIITAKVGYGDAVEDIPAPIREAIKQIVAQMYENRGDAKADEDMPAIAVSLLRPYRIFTL